MTKWACLGEEKKKAYWRKCSRIEWWDVCFVKRLVKEQKMLLFFLLMLWCCLILQSFLNCFISDVHFQMEAQLQLHSLTTDRLCLIQIWCVGSPGDSQPPSFINQTVDGNTLTAVLKGLLPGVLYQVEVAAVSSAGVGTRSQPVPIRKLHSSQWC